MSNQIESLFLVISELSPFTFIDRADRFNLNSGFIFLHDVFSLFHLLDFFWYLGRFVSLF